MKSALINMINLSFLSGSCVGQKLKLSAGLELRLQVSNLNWNLGTIFMTVDRYIMHFVQKVLA